MVPINLIVGPVRSATGCNALCRGVESCQRRSRGLAVDFGPEQSGWLAMQLGNLRLKVCQADQF